MHDSEIFDRNRKALICCKFCIKDVIKQVLSMAKVDSKVEKVKNSSAQELFVHIWIWEAFWKETRNVAKTFTNLESDMLAMAMNAYMACAFF